MESMRLTRLQITSKADCKNLCLTCEDLRSLVVPQLYNSVSLNIEGLKQVEASFHSANPGLSYVRNLKIDDCLDTYRYNYEAHGKALSYLLRIIPENSLTSFL